MPPCAVKTCAVLPVFARVVGELRAADPSNVHGPVKQNASPEAQSEAPRTRVEAGSGAERRTRKPGQSAHVGATQRVFPSENSTSKNVWENSWKSQTSFFQTSRGLLSKLLEGERSPLFSWFCGGLDFLRCVVPLGIPFTFRPFTFLAKSVTLILLKKAPLPCNPTPLRDPDSPPKFGRSQRTQPY